MSPAFSKGEEHRVFWPRPVVLAGLVLAIALAGCANAKQGQGTGSGISTTTTDSTVTSPTTAVPSDADIAAELLVLRDFPPGWSQFGGAGTGPQNRGCLSPLTSSDGRLNRADAQFQGGIDDSQYIDEILESFPPGGALTELVHFRQVVAGCTQVTVAASGLSFTGRITTIALPTFGDDSTAYRVDLTTDVGTMPITLGYGLVIARRGDTVMVVVASNVDPAGVVQLLQQAARAAMAKVT